MKFLLSDKALPGKHNRKPALFGFKSPSKEVLQSSKKFIVIYPEVLIQLRA